MARGLGIHLAPGVSAEIAPFGAGFNCWSIFIDVAPVFVLMYTQEWNRFFSVKSFVLGAALNLLLASHVLFVLDDGHDHRDVLFVSILGFCLSTAFALFNLIHRALTENDHSARCLVVLALGGFFAGSFWLVGAIFANYRSDGWVINFYGLIAVVAVNLVTLLPILRCKGFPDETVLFHTACMCILNTVDAAFFVGYSYILGSFGTFLSVVSIINALCGVAVLLALIVPPLAKGLRNGVRNGVRKLKNCCLGCAARCSGCIRLVDTLCDLFGRRHQRNE